jgi:hypothetical protein
MRWGPLAGAVVALGAAALLVALQPVGQAWWHWADPDGAYVGNSLNILDGNHTYYLDHPGLPTQDALALASGAELLVGKATGAYDSRQEYVDERLLDLDGSRVFSRAWAIALFLGATLVAYLAVGRLLGHWTWGLAGALLFVTAPELGSISFILRPDAVVAGLCLGIGYLVATAFEQRSALLYTAAAALLGFAMTWKLTAVGMAVPLAVAAVWRYPGPEWFREVARSLAAFARRHAAWLAPASLLWLVLCYLFNRDRLPILQTDDQRTLLVTGATFLLGYAGFAWLAERFAIPWADRIFRLFYAWLMLAFVVGLLLPATLILDDGVQMLVSMKDTLTGGRVNEGVDPFDNFSFETVRRYPLNAAAVVVALGLAAGAVAFVRRQYWPLLLALGSLVLATMAAARYSADYYFAPAFAVAIPGALWIFKRPRTSALPVYLWVPVAALLVWTVSNVQSWEQRQEEEIDAAAQALADELLRPGEVILATHYYFPIEDVRYDTLVDGFVDHVPEYPYRFLHRPQTAAERGLVPRYVSAPDAELPAPGTTASLDVGGAGPFVVEGLDRRWGPGDQYRLARIVQLPPLEP